MGEVVSMERRQGETEAARAEEQVSTLSKY